MLSGIGIFIGQNVAAQSGGGVVATTWNPANSSTDWTISGGNLSAIRNVTTAGFWAMLRATAAKTNGTFIVTVNALGTGAPIVCSIGIDAGTETQFPGQDVSGISIGYLSDGNIDIGGGPETTVASYTTGDVIKVVKAGADVSFYKQTAGAGSFVLQATITTNAAGSGHTGIPGNGYPAASNGNGTGTQLTGDFSGW